MQHGQIDLLAPPFKGHLHPILAMGRLLAPDYDICVFSSASAQADIEAAGLKGIILESVDDKVLMDIVSPPYVVGNSPLALRKQFRGVLPFLQKLSQELEEIYSTRRPDLMIADFVIPVAGLVADRFNIPWWTSIPPVCVLECPDGPPAYLGGLQPATSPLGELRNFLGRKLVRVFKRVIFRCYAKEIKALGLQQVYRKDGSEAIYSSRRILCLSHQGLEFTHNWPPQVSLIGPMLYSPPTSSLQPDFLAGKKYILVTLGTHVDAQKDRVCAAVEQVVEKFPDYVFHFTDGHSETQSMRKINEQLYRFSYINYQEHIASYDLVVHHAGTGILYHCLLNGIPSLAYPVDYDQFDYAARLEHHGFSVWLKDISNLDKALATALASEEMKCRVKEFAGTLRDTVDAGEFLELVREHMSSSATEIHDLSGIPRGKI
ncbi:MAG: glycosyltransferase [Candidatus Electrothrix scaldis]|nr:MAG: glycosyltransferase [Candidatus Electrothrix sp. GW3-3]